jgi:hypothetical protein
MIHSFKKTHAARGESRASSSERPGDGEEAAPGQALDLTARC